MSDEIDISFAKLNVRMELAEQINSEINDLLFFDLFDEGYFDIGNEADVSFLAGTYTGLTTALEIISDNLDNLDVKDHVASIQKRFYDALQVKRNELQ